MDTIPDHPRRVSHNQAADPLEHTSAAQGERVAAMTQRPSGSDGGAAILLGVDNEHPTGPYHQMSMFAGYVDGHNAGQPACAQAQPSAGCASLPTAPRRRPGAGGPDSNPPAATRQHAQTSPSHGPSSCEDFRQRNEATVGPTPRQASVKEPHSAAASAASRLGGSHRRPTLPPPAAPPMSALVQEQRAGSSQAGRGRPGGRPG